MARLTVPLALRRRRARLTMLGRDVVGRYRSIEGAAATAAAADIRALKAALPSQPANRTRDEQ